MGPKRWNRGALEPGNPRPSPGGPVRPPGQARPRKGGIRNEAQRRKGRTRLAAEIDPAGLEAIRAQLPALTHGTYLNTGTAGPLPQAAATALRESVLWEYEQGRIGGEAGRRGRDAAAAVRSALARLLETTPERLALTHHSTDGLNAVALGLRLQPGDAVVITDLEHAAVQLVAGMLRLRAGIEVRVARLAGVCGGVGPDDHGARVGGVDPQRAAAAVEPLLRDGRVRAVFLSHVSYATGAVLPLAAIAHVAHAAGAAVVVDGAQGAGALPVRPAALVCDFYTVSGQKWLCGPEGTGALWVASGWEERLLPAVTGYAGVAQMDRLEGHFLPAHAARRLEVGTTFGPGLLAWGASLQWLEGIGWAAIHARTASLARRCRQALAAVAGVQLLTPPESAGLVAFRIAGLTGETAATRLEAGGFRVRSIPGWDAVRVSLGFFLQDGEVDRLATAVADLVPR